MLKKKAEKVRVNIPRNQAKDIFKYLLWIWKPILGNKT
jgi:hypothetical protein